MLKHMMPAFRVTLFFTVLTGLIYPGVVMALCQLVFPYQANGNLITVNGKVVGSKLIGQNFARPEYFHPRPSAAGSDGYDGSASSGSNLGPTSQNLIARVQASINQFRKENPDYQGKIPADLVTASASGLDPHISPSAAKVQAARIAKSRGVTLDKIRLLIGRHTEGQEFGFLGDRRVNVLVLNLALDREFPLR